MDYCPVENGVEMAAVEGPTIQPQLHSVRKQTLQMFACRRKLAADSRVHLMVVMQHRWRTQELQSAHHRVPHDMDHGDPLQANADLDEDDTDLRERGIGERSLG